MANPTLIGPSLPAAGIDNYYRQQRVVDSSNWGSTDGYEPMYTLQVSDESAAPKLTPSGNGNIDIVANFNWTYSKYRDEVPRMMFIERQIKKNQQLAYYKRALGVFLSEASDGSQDPYAGLYADAKKTGFTYIFPYYASSTVNISQSWSASINSASNIYGSVAEKVANAKYTTNNGIEFSAGGVTSLGTDLYAMYKNTPMFGYEQPQYYSGPSISSFTVKFPLYNTDSVADIRRNFDFVKIFGYQNLFERRTFGTSLPPVMYECEFAPGHIGTVAAKPAVYVSRFDVKNIGAIRSIDIGIGNSTKVLIPEAYLIEIQFTELIANSRNIFSSFLTGQSLVNVYQDSGDGDPGGQSSQGN